MNIDAWDRFENALAELVVGSAMPLNKAIAALVHIHGSEDSEALLLASVSLCANLDETLGIGVGTTVQLSLARYKYIAAFASDIAALPKNNRTCRHLIAHWAKTNDVFFMPHLLV